ncbi:DUF6285 domain-containing protein [soil metagenome]
MQDLPETRDILQAVAAWIRDEALPQLPSHAAFQARVAANALDLVRRELCRPEAVHIDEVARLERLTGQTGSISVMTETLSARLRDGSFNIETPGLIDHLWATTLDKMAVDQPAYAAYQRALVAASQTD